MPSALTRSAIRRLVDSLSGSRFSNTLSTGAPRYRSSCRAAGANDFCYQNTIENVPSTTIIRFTIPAIEADQIYEIVFNLIRMVWIR